MAAFFGGGGDRRSRGGLALGLVAATLLDGGLLIIVGIAIMHYFTPIEENLSGAGHGRSRLVVR